MINEFCLEDLPGEIWKDIPDAPGYQVSSLGRVKSLARIIMRKNGRGMPLSEQIISINKSTHGYYKVSLYIGAKRTTYYVHSLVMKTFIGPCPEGFEINHKEGNKKDNRVVMLEYITHRENIKHAYTSGLFSKVKRKPSTKLTLEEINQIKSLKSILSGNDISKLYNVGSSTVYAILNNINWKENIDKHIGEGNPSAKLTSEEVRYIKNAKGKISQNKLAKMFLVGKSTIRDIHQEKTWKHITTNNEAIQSQDIIRKENPLKERQNNTAKLTKEQIIEIRKLKGEFSLKKIGDMFGVSDTTIYKIHKGLAYKDIK